MTTDDGVTMPQAMTERSWLLRNKLNPFPVGGDLSWDGQSLTFTIGALAGSAVLGWLADRLAVDAGDLKTRLEGGEAIEVFRASRSEFDVVWPKVMGGAALEITDRTTGHAWLISLDYPSGGPIHQTISLISGRKKAKTWRAALGAG